MIPSLHSLMFPEADLFCVSWGGFTVQLSIALLYPFTFEMLSFKVYYLPYEVCYCMGSLVM